MAMMFIRSSNEKLLFVFACKDGQIVVEMKKEKKKEEDFLQVGETADGMSLFIKGGKRRNLVWFVVLA